MAFSRSKLKAPPRHTYPPDPAKWSASDTKRAFATLEQMRPLRSQAQQSITRAKTPTTKAKYRAELRDLQERTNMLVSYLNRTKTIQYLDDSNPAWRQQKNAPLVLGRTADFLDYLGKKRKARRAYSDKKELILGFLAYATLPEEVKQERGLNVEISMFRDLLGLKPETDVSYLTRA